VKGLVRVALVALCTSSLGCGEHETARGAGTDGGSGGHAGAGSGAGGLPSALGGKTGSAGTNAGGISATGATGATATGATAGEASTAGADSAGGSGSGGSANGVAGEDFGGSGGGMAEGCENVAGSQGNDEIIVGTAEKFSFFITSLGAMRALSGSEDGFGGDLTFGETGPGAGLRGADKICRTIAEMSMPGASRKGWHAFLSATSDGCGSGPIHAIDRIGAGPWYDRLGRLVAENPAALLNERPQGADAAIVDDLPNENGVPNKTDGVSACGPGICSDNHDILTGSDEAGQLSRFNLRYKDTCNDWTLAEDLGGRPSTGHSWPASSGKNWIYAHQVQGCLPGVSDARDVSSFKKTVGWAGGYGGLYCFARSP
jgi:predicted small secreted protein